MKEVPNLGCSPLTDVAPTVQHGRPCSHGQDLALDMTSIPSIIPEILYPEILYPSQDLQKLLSLQPTATVQ